MELIVHHVHIHNKHYQVIHVYVMMDIIWIQHFIVNYVYIHVQNVKQMVIIV